MYLDLLIEASEVLDERETVRMVSQDLPAENQDTAAPIFYTHHAFVQAH